MKEDSLYPGMFYQCDQEMGSCADVVKSERLELGEALHIFMGAVKFDRFYHLPADEANYLQRDRVFFKFLYKKDEYQKLFLKYYKSAVKSIKLHFDIPNIEELDAEIKGIRFHTHRSSLTPEQHLLEEPLLYVVNKEWLIRWALHEGIVLPEKVQIHAGILQSTLPPLSKAQIRVAVIQAIAQLLWFLNPPIPKTEIIDQMRNIFDFGVYDGQNLRKSCHGNLACLFEKAYFLDEKQTSLQTILKAVDTRPVELKKGRPNKNGAGCSFSFRPIPGVMDSGKIHFHKLKLVLQTIGYYFYGFRVVGSLEDLLQNCLIQGYLKNQGKIVQKFAEQCLRDVCPDRLWIEMERTGRGERDRIRSLIKNTPIS